MTRKKKYYDENTIIAEIVHLPSEKIGNVIERKINTEYYIGYIDEISGKKKIDLNDLCVSVVNDKVVLRSKSLGKNVLPVFSNAYNIMHPTNSPVFEFLLDFQAQYNTSLLINEDSLLKLFKFFPRLQKEITLSRKQPGRSNIMISLKIKRQVFQRLSPLLTKTLICLIYREIFSSQKETMNYISF